MTAPTTGTQPHTTYREIFAVGEFRALFAMVLLRALATTAEILGLSVLVYARTGSALLSAVAYGIGFLPQLVGGALLTSLADRLSPRGVISVLALVRAAPGALIGLIDMPIAAMLVLVAGIALLDPAAGAARGRLMPAILDGDRYVLGRSIMSATASGAQILGLGVGGVILAFLSARQLLLLAAAALIGASALAWFGLQHHRSTPTAGTGRGSIRATLTGNAALWSERRIRGLMLAQWLPAWFVTAAESLLVPYAGALGRPESTASVLLAALPVGMVTGQLVVGRLCTAPTRERLSFPLATLIGIPLLAFALHLPVTIGAALLVVTGAGFGYALGLQRRFLDVLPGHRQGQAFGLLGSGAMGGQGAGPAAAGGLATVLGPGAAIAIAGGATILASLWLHNALTDRPTPRRSHHPATI